MLPSNQRTNFRSGFTFVEVLAAMFFMALVVPVVMHGFALANRAGVAAKRKRQATELADRVLTEAAATETWRGGRMSSDFGEDAPGFRYELSTGNWPEDSMELLTVRVFYTVQDHEYSESLSTLVFINEEDNQNMNSTATAGGAS